jgi:ATP-binding cassette subfamily B protein/ATP-binding cassette subfamily C protein
LASWYNYFIFRPHSIIYLIRLRSIAVPHWGSYRQVNGEFFGFLGEQLTGIEDIRANGAKTYVMHRFYKILQRWLPTYHKARFADTILWDYNNVYSR